MQRSYVSRLNATFTLNEMEEMEVSSTSLAEVIFWLDWWMVTDRSLAKCTEADVAKVHCLFSAGDKTMVLMANVRAVSWNNCPEAM